MADGLIDIIQPRLPIIHKVEDKTRNNYRWIKVYDMRDDLNGYWNIPFQNPNVKGVNLLEVIGNKVNLKAEKKIDKEFNFEHANKVIFRNIRYVALKFYRIWISKIKLKQLRRENCAIKIQCMYRCYKSIKIAEKLVEKAKLEARESAANLIQAAYQTWKLRNFIFIKE